MNLNCLQTTYHEKTALSHFFCLFTKSLCHVKYETLNEDDQHDADRLLRKVAKAYPSLDIKARENYTFVPELKAVALLRARAIGIDRSYYEEIPATENPISEK